MSRWGTISFLVAGLSLAILVAFRYVIGGWINFLFIPLGLFLAGLLVALIVDFKFYLEFFKMRTTKHGMNMGAMILLFVVLLVSLNFLAVRHNRTFDMTAERLNSLSEQSQDVLAKVGNDVRFTVLYKGQGATDMRQQLRQAFMIYQENSSKVRTRFIDVYVENLLAQEYLNELPDRDHGEVFFFVEYGERRLRVDAPYGEEQITSAIIRATREDVKNIYIITGHGERDIDSNDAEGASGFRQALEDSSFKVHKWSIIEQGLLPEKADVVAILGPATQYLDQEMDLLRSYARSGGRLFIAIDPGQRHNLANLTKSFGVEFQNNYIINEIASAVGRGSASAIGVVYDRNSEVTRRMTSGSHLTMYDVASELRVDPGAHEDLRFVELVMTDSRSFTLPELQQPSEIPPRGSKVLAISVEGQLPPPTDDPEFLTDPRFAAVVFGDSDFLTNKSIIQWHNRDIAVNAISYLAEESDLITIRPKSPAGTHLILTRTTQASVVIAGLSLPVIFLILSGVLWYRRRGA